MNKVFCTVADHNFRHRVWALNQSLLQSSKEYTLYVLALDKEARQAFSENNWKNTNINVIDLDHLIAGDRHLLNCSQNSPSYEALNVTGGDVEKATRMQFIWSLSAYFTWYCLDKYEPEDILYIDADIYFFDDWTKVYKNLNDASIGIVEHRCPYSPNNGKYNVGIVYFKNDFEGYKCSTWWKNCLLFSDNEYQKTHGMCGDQKYLELFEKLFDGVEVLDKYFAHLAPWNYAYHGYDGYGSATWEGKVQKIMYCHFSNFKPDYEKNTYLMAPRHGIKNTTNAFISKIYDEYFECLRRVND
jgi:hypothetical protein